MWSEFEVSADTPERWLPEGFPDYPEGRWNPLYDSNPLQNGSRHFDECALVPGVALLWRPKW
jgi:hypothetical protein